MKKFPLTLFLFWISFQVIIAQQIPNRSALTIEQIMQGERFVGFSPEGIRWGNDSKTVYFSWNPEGDTLRSLYKIDSQGNQAKKVNLEEESKLLLRGRYNKDRNKKVLTKNGDVFLVDLQRKESIQITNTIAVEYNPQFSGDETKIIFTSSNNLFSWDIASGSLTQLSDFRKGKESVDPKLPENEQWLKNDQLTYFDILKERKAERDLEKRLGKERKVKRPLKIYLENKRLSNLNISPDLNFITYRLTKVAKAKGTKVPNYVTEEGYLKDYNSRVKVGSAENSYELGVYDIQKDTSYIVNTNQIDGIYEKPEFLKAYYQDTLPYQEKYDKTRSVIFHGPLFSEDGKALVVIRSLDNKDRWLMLLDLDTGRLELLDRQRDEAWVGGPGISGWNSVVGNVGWLSDNQTIWFQSEETGFSHLYTLDTKTKAKQKLTKGAFEVHEVWLSNDKKYFYLVANAEGPHERHFYRMSVNGGQMERLSKEPGRYEVYPSPDESHFALRYSYSNKPWELYLLENKPGAEMQKCTKSTTSDFDRYPWREPEIVWFAARDDMKVPARLYRPKEVQAKGPAVIFVHGAGYLQNVHNWWSSYYREYMFHNMLVDNGYTVLDIDYRGSEGYGRNWRTAIYQHMGGKDLTDQIDGARFLVENYDIDPQKMGIYGGSYGGFITLMAMFKEAGTFQCGAALRSVTDWAHYNHPYTSNILNTPAEDSLAYYRSSPIYHAEGLSGHLLMLHGMIDTNVQYQDVVRLSQRLIELGKNNWELAVFPLEGHGFVEPSSWTDEYKRIFKLFQLHLK